MKNEIEDFEKENKKQIRKIILMSVIFSFALTLVCLFLGVLLALFLIEKLQQCNIL